MEEESDHLNFGEEVLLLPCATPKTNESKVDLKILFTFVDVVDDVSNTSFVWERTFGEAKKMTVWTLKTHVAAHLDIHVNQVVIGYINYYSEDYGRHHGPFYPNQENTPLSQYYSFDYKGYTMAVSILLQGTYKGMSVSLAAAFEQEQILRGLLEDEKRLFYDPWTQLERSLLLIAAIANFIAGCDQWNSSCQWFSLLGFLDFISFYVHVLWHAHYPRLKKTSSDAVEMIGMLDAIVMFTFALMLTISQTSFLCLVVSIAFTGGMVYLVSARRRAQQAWRFDHFKNITNTQDSKVQTRRMYYYPSLFGRLSQRFHAYWSSSTIRREGHNVFEQS